MNRQQPCKNDVLTVVYLPIILILNKEFMTVIVCTMSDALCASKVNNNLKGVNIPPTFEIQSISPYEIRS